MERERERGREREREREKERGRERERERERESIFPFFLLSFLRSAKIFGQTFTRTTAAAAECGEMYCAGVVCIASERTKPYAEKQPRSLGDGLTDSGGEGG